MEQLQAHHINKQTNKPHHMSYWFNTTQYIFPRIVKRSIVSLIQRFYVMSNIVRYLSAYKHWSKHWKMDKQILMGLNLFAPDLIQ